jgi:uncharacterized membrane protein
MKKVSFFSGSLILLTTLFTLQSCYNDKQELLQVGTPDCANFNIQKGPNFTSVRTIIRSNCGNCHLNGGNSAGYNFDNDCDIVNNWNQINKSCVTYQLNQMPPSSQLSTSQKSQITAWVNAGHRYTD